MAEGDAPFELIYGVPQMMDRAEVRQVISSSTEESRRMEQTATATLRAIRSNRKPLKQEIRGNHKFEVRDYVLVAKGTALSTIVKSPSFSSKNFGLRGIARGVHLGYQLVSEHVLVTDMYLRRVRLALYTHSHLHDISASVSGLLGIICLNGWCRTGWLCDGYTPASILPHM